MSVLDWTMVGFIVVVVVISGIGVYKVLKE
jgi:hypothetical protein